MVLPSLPLGWQQVTKKKEQYGRHTHVNDTYRNGGNLAEDRESGRDLVSDMKLARSRVDVLANDLARMGWSVSGDEPVHPDERHEERDYYEPCN